MKKFLLLIYFFPCLFFGQQNKIDSLNLCLSAAKHDTTRLNIYLQLCEFCELEDNLKYATPALNIVNKLCSSSPLHNQKEKYLRTKLRIYLFFKIYYQVKEDFKNLELVNKHCLKISEEINDQELINNSINDLVDYYIKAGNITKALEIHINRLKLFELNGNKKQVVYVLNQISSLYVKIRNFKKALDYELKALQLAEAINDKEELPWLLFNTGTRYQSLKDYKNARTYLLKSYSLLKNKITDRQTVKAVFQLAECYRLLGDYNEARKYKFQCLKIGEDLRDTMLIGQTLCSIGDVYMTEQNYKIALEYELKGIALLRKIGARLPLVWHLLSVAEIYEKQSNINLALNYAQEALNITVERNEPYQQRVINKYLNKLYSAIGDKINSEKHLLNYYVLNDTLSRQENAEALLYKEMNYENDKNEFRLLAEQERKDAIVIEEKKNQQIILVFVAGGLILLALFSVFVLRNLRITRKQKQTIEEQKHLVEEKQKEVLDSITYAKRLQQAILPSDAEIKKHLPQSFVYYQPKDIVAGDFYWFEFVDGLTFIAAADSTGHGVPGAMVSVVCSNALNRAVKEFGLRNTGEILDKIRELVIETFEKSDKDVKDGMDISLIRIKKTKNENEIQWSGAFNPLYFFSDNEFKEIKANKQPIGKHSDPLPFTSHSITLTSSASFYLFSDGYADQFSPDDKKLMTRKFKEILTSIQHLSMEAQGKHLENFHNTWKGNMEQTDDVLVIGIRV